MPFNEELEDFVVTDICRVVSIYRVFQDELPYFRKTFLRLNYIYITKNSHIET
jgi:hypothetical protein